MHKYRLNTLYSCRLHLTRDPAALGMYNIMAAYDSGTEPYESWEALDDPSVSRFTAAFKLPGGGTTTRAPLHVTQVQPVDRTSVPSSRLIGRCC